MHPRRILTIAIASGGLALGCVSMLGGCSDESRTTGTQVQLTPEKKAEIESMRGVMRGQKATAKQEQTAGKKKGR